MQLPMEMGGLFGALDPLQEAIRRARYGQQPVFGSPSEQPAQDIQGGLLGKLDQKLQPFGGLLGVGANLLAESGRNGSFGGSLGNALLAGRQTAADNEQNKLRGDYMKAQIEAMQRPQRAGTPQTVIGPDGKPILTSDWEGKTPYQEAKGPGGGIGQYSPGDYTPESWAKFLQTSDPAILKRYTTPRQDYAPSYQNVTRLRPDGSTQYGVFDSRSGTYKWDDGIVPAGTKKRTEAEGAAVGEATGAQQTKKPAVASMDYVLKQMEGAIDRTPQGGIGGVIGKSGVVTNYGDTRRFDNLREQLSTEIRTVYRIPGEGTLSDREQAQYGIQLPDRANPAEVNRAIINDLRERTRLRTETPIGGNAPKGAAPSGINEGQTATNPKTGERMVYKGGKWVRQ